MRTISGALKTAVSQRGTTLARLVDITLANGRVFRFTNSDADITYAGNVYASNPGCNPSQVRSVLGTSAESVTVNTLIHPAGVTSALIESGALDDARLRVLVVDYTNPASAVVFFQGYVSSVSYKDKITASIVAQPLVSRDVELAQDVYSSNCRADLGDNKCRVNIEAMKVTAAIVDAGDLQSFVTTDNSDDHHWQAGTIIIMSGDNEGFSFEIRDNLADGTMALRGLLPFPLAVGDLCVIYPGCDKSPVTCRARYANILNFRGEPFAIAPWIATAQAPITTTTKTTSSAVGVNNKRPLYVHWGFVSGPNFALQLLNSGVTALDGSVDVSNPEWGPVLDVWGFGPSQWPPQLPDVNAGSGGTSTLDPYMGQRIVVVSSTMRKLYFDAGGSIYGLSNFVEFGNRPLSDDEAALVRKKYADA